ncbi:MAG: tetratricopeptide repeat protein, partial [Thermodesulfobacteriota bacterium]|nr:tetratricopeptide repeat protein [Thermodesulfobacteriota bacterium]
WPEKMTWKGADIFGRALEAFYIYSAYGDPNEGKIDLHPFKKVVATSPGSFMGLNVLGWVCYRNKRYQSAKDAFLRALLANPNSPGVMSGLMWCGVYTKDEEEALYWASRKATVMDENIETARQKTLNRLKKVKLK